MFLGRLHTARWMATTAFVGALAITSLLPLSASALAQDTVTPMAPPQQVALPMQPAYTPAQLDAMVAPIALYPDQLLSEMLMAAAYPDEVVAADRWVHDPATAGLRGEALAEALAPIDWDPSVKSLVPFPQVLDSMARHLDWTQQIGWAFITQQPQVMDAVQRLRREAWADSSLRPTPQLAVMSRAGVIVIEPAMPDIIYVPVYDPAVVYGTWRYPAPPVEFYPAAAYTAPIVFSVRFEIVRSFWGWSRCDWSHHHVFVDPPRVNAINARLIERDHRPHLEAATWHVDPSRRHDAARTYNLSPAAVRHDRAASSPSHETPAAVHPGASPARSAKPEWQHAPLRAAHAPSPAMPAHSSAMAPASRPSEARSHEDHRSPLSRPAPPHPAIAAVPRTPAPHVEPRHAEPHPGPAPHPEGAHPAPAHGHPEHGNTPDRKDR